MPLLRRDLPFGERLREEVLVLPLEVSGKKAPRVLHLTGGRRTLEHTRRVIGDHLRASYAERPPSGAQIATRPWATSAPASFSLRASGSEAPNPSVLAGVLRAGIRARVVPGVRLRGRSGVLLLGGRRVLLRGRRGILNRHRGSGVRRRRRARRRGRVRRRGRRARLAADAPLAARERQDVAARGLRRAVAPFGVAQVACPSPSGRTRRPEQHPPQRPMH